MKTFVHNFLSIFRRHQMAAVLNLLGLTMAFVAFMILMMQVSFDYGYDRFHKNSKRIYRAELQMGAGAQAVFPRPLIETFFDSSPHIVESAIACRWDEKRNVTVEHTGARHSFQETFYMVSSGYPRVFDFTFVAGDPDALEHPEKVIIPESMAKRFFPDRNAVGQHLDGEELKAEIGAVYKDFPQNSILKNSIYGKIPDSHGAGIWNNHNYEGFLLLDKASNKKYVLENFETNFTPTEYTMKENKIRLTNLPDVYYTTDVVWDSQKTKGSRLQVFVLACIAFLILLIAAVNFMNFSNALVPIRIKSINTQKVLGCTVNALRVSIIIEAVIFCIFSFFLAGLILAVISDTDFNSIVSGGISISGHIPLLIGCGFIAILTGVAAGSWPAFYITSFSPALVLKGNFGLSIKGKNLRTLLISMQYISTFVLIVVAIFVTLQNNYMMRSSIGFEKDQMVIIELNRQLGGNIELVRQQLNGIPEIEAVAGVDRIPGGGDSYSTYVRTYEGKNVKYELIRTDHHIFNVLGTTVTEGREFTTDDYAGNGSLIFNETARKKWELEAGKTMNLDWEDFHLRERIVGFMDDIKYNSHYTGLKPFAFFLSSNETLRNYVLARVRTGTNYTALIASINKILTDIDPDYPLNISLYDQVFENLYQKELLLGNQIFFFSLTAIFISLIGVFGIVLFENQYKRKEISIRKVFGSTIEEVVLLLSDQYIKILSICFVLASPIAYIAVSKWLENFAYRTPLYLWVFILAFVIVTFLTLLTVTLQNWWIARTNPIEALRSE